MLRRVRDDARNTRVVRGAEALLRRPSPDGLSVAGVSPRANARVLSRQGMHVIVARARWRPGHRRCGAPLPSRDGVQHLGWMRARRGRLPKRLLPRRSCAHVSRVVRTHRHARDDRERCVYSTRSGEVHGGTALPQGFRVPAHVSGADDRTAEAVRAHGSELSSGALSFATDSEPGPHRGASAASDRGHSGSRRGRAWPRRSRRVR
jgi:hypothetical protein